MARHGWDSAERAIGALQPTYRLLSSAETLLCEGDDAGQAIETVGFKARQPAAPAPALQAARREIEGVSQLLEGKTGRVHQLLDDRRRKTLADGFAQIALAGEVSSESKSAPEFL
jgi:hypothetical protein